MEGALRSTSSPGRDGKKRTRTEVVATDVLFAGEKGAPAPERAAPAQGELRMARLG